MTDLPVGLDTKLMNARRWRGRVGLTSALRLEPASGRQLRKSCNA
jgi:hypothetical protein